MLFLNIFQLTAARTRLFHFLITVQRPGHLTAEHLHHAPVLELARRGK